MNNVMEALPCAGETESWTSPRKIAQTIRACGLVPTFTEGGWGVRFPDDGLPAWTEELWPEGTEVPDSIRWLDGYPDPAPEKKDRWDNPYRRHMLKQFAETAVPRATGTPIPPDVARSAGFTQAFDKACIMLTFECDGRPEPTLANVARALTLYGIGCVRRTERGRIDLETVDTPDYRTSPVAQAMPLSTPDAIAFLRTAVIRWFCFDPGKARVKECLDMALALGQMDWASNCADELGAW